MEKIFLSFSFIFFYFCYNIHYTKNVLHKLFIQPLCYIQFCEKLSNNFPQSSFTRVFSFHLGHYFKRKSFFSFLDLGNVHELSNVIFWWFITHPSPLIIQNHINPIQKLMVPEKPIPPSPSRNLWTPPIVSLFYDCHYYYLFSFLDRSQFQFSPKSYYENFQYKKKQKNSKLITNRFFKKDNWNWQISLGWPEFLFLKDF